MATAYPLLYSIPRARARARGEGQDAARVGARPRAVAAAAKLLDETRARARAVPAAPRGSFRPRSGPGTWRASTRRAGHLVAEALPLNNPNWDRDGTTAEAHTLLADLDPVNTVSLLGGSSMQLANLRGVAGPLMDSWHQRRAAMDLTRRLHGSTGGHGGATARDERAVGVPVQRFRGSVRGARGVFGLARHGRDRARVHGLRLGAPRRAAGKRLRPRFGRDAARARLPSSVGADRERCRARRQRARLLRRGLVYRGPERPVHVAAESNRWIAEALLVRAAMSPAEKRPALLLPQASTQRASAVLALTDSTFARRCSPRAARGWSRC